MAAPREAPRLAILAKGPPPRWKGPLASSVLVHALLIFAVSYDFSCANLGPADRMAGGPGPIGGGGGGGGDVVGYIALPIYQPPAAEQEPTPEREVPPEEMVINLPVPQVQDVETSAALRERQRINLAEVLGRGEGTGGGPGRGTGTGGGQGGGEGTGVGNATGPGSGGNGGDLFTAQPVTTILPPEGAPNGVKGRPHIIRFRIAADGRVLEIDFVTPVRDGGYRRRWLERLRQFEFRPATTRDGTPVESIFEMVLTP